MRAVVIGRFGGPEVLELREVPTPEPARGEVRVRVRATAVNRADLLQRMGAYPAPPGVPADIPGLELAGEIAAVGADVNGWRVGDRVFGLAGGGAYAEEIVVHAATLARIPARLSFVEAAAVPEAFITAWDALVTQAGLGAGETVLIHAVGSGVGTAATQIARALHARAIGTARTAAKLERAVALGLTHGITVSDARFAAEVRRVSDGHGADVILELVGGPYLAEDVRAAAHQARIAVVGLMAGVQVEVDFATILRQRLRLFGTVLRARPLDEKIATTRQFARHVVPLFEAGVLVPVIDRVLPLAEAAQAHQLTADNQGFGKIVLEV